MNRLILLRHATAEPEGYDVDDFERALTPQGWAEARHTGSLLKAAGMIPDLALVSAARRARETWEGAAEALGDIETIINPALYQTNGHAILELAKAQAAASIIVVGHNPTFHSLAVKLLTKDDRAGAELEALRYDFPKGAAIAFRFGGEGPRFEGLYP